MLKTVEFWTALTPAGQIAVDRAWIEPEDFTILQFGIGEVYAQINNLSESDLAKIDHLWHATHAHLLDERDALPEEDYNLATLAWMALYDRLDRITCVGLESVPAVEAKE